MKKMKIAIVGPGFTGATFPLAQQIHKLGNDIDCYYLTRIGLNSIESLDFGEELTPHHGILKISQANRLYKYLNSEIGVYIIPIYRRHAKFEKILVGYLPRIANYLRKKKFIKLLLCKKYDRIILIDHFDDGQILNSLRKSNVKIVTSYHEIYTSLLGNNFKKGVIKSLNAGCPVIVHCNHIKDDIINKTGIPNIEHRVNVIRVGPFESLFQYADGKEIPGIGENYFLFLGRITTYKGLKVLYDAMEEISTQWNIKVVIAGNGFDPIMKKMKKNKNYVLINRYIQNDEMVWLVNHCRAIVCPYLAASQSGLMPLAFAYNKPIVSTKVGAFPEVIEDGVTGYLSERISGAAFAKALKRCIENENKFTGIPLPKSVNWEFISSQVMELLYKI